MHLKFRLCKYFTLCVFTVNAQACSGESKLYQKDNWLFLLSKIVTYFFYKKKNDNKKTF